MQPYYSVRYIAYCFALLINFCVLAAPEQQPSLKMEEGLIDISNQSTLGLSPASGTSHYTVFAAHEKTAQYNHGAVLFDFKGKLFCQWQTSKKDEDAPDTHVVYSISSSGQQWQQPRVLAPTRKDAIVTSGGWWSDGESLIAFINVWPNDLSPKAGHTEYAISNDGVSWSTFQPVTNHNGEPVKGIIEQDLKSTSTGRILTAFHHQPGLVATPYYTDDPLAISNWQPALFSNLPFKGDISRELEPSWFSTPGGEIIMTFRDQGSSYRILAAASADDGKSWSFPQITNIPDSRAKQSAGNLPDGTAFIVNNPTGNKTRMPLVIFFSGNGQLFDKAWVLRDQSSLPAMRFEGKYKRKGFSYPKSYIWNNALWVSYAVNKEDITVTRLPLNQSN